MIKTWFINNLWWMLQIFGSLGVVLASSISRTYGLTTTTYIIYLLIAASVFGWSFTYSYELAPSFIQPWFVAQGALSVLGFAASLLYFDIGVVSVYQIIGALLTIVGGVLLIL
jgi:hypothetical protein